MKLLIDSQPLLVLKELAEQIGLNEAIFLQQLHYWINGSNAHFVDGKWWVYNTYEDWKEDNFPFWSVKTIKRIVNNLRDIDLITTTNLYNGWIQDNTLWYTINYEKLKYYENESARIQELRRKNKEQKKKEKEEKRTTRKMMELKNQLLKTRKVECSQNDPTVKTSKIEQGQNDPTEGTKCPYGGDKMTRAIPEITTENTSKIKNNNNKNKNNEQICKDIKDVVDEEDVNSIKERIEKITKNKIGHKALEKLIINKGRDIINYYLDNYKKFKVNKHNPVGFLIKAITEEYPIPDEETNKYDSRKPIQSTNFEQRQYDDEYFDDLYDN